MRLLFLARVLILALILGVCAWSLLIEPNLLPVRDYALKLRGGSAQDLRVVVLADLHIGAPQHGLRQLQRIVREANAIKPDLVLMAGDYLYRGPFGRDIVAVDLGPALGRLQARFGVYAVLGNHDNATGARAMRVALEGAGIQVLENASVLLELPNQQYLRIVGISDYWTTHLRLARGFREVAQHERSIVLTHNPDVFPELTGYPFDLAIAGHTHGGQVRLPLVGLLYVPSRYGERFLRGVIHEEGRQYFVSPGIGMSILPVRFRAPPEISLLHIAL